VKKNPLLKEKIYGCLVGVAAGDAMGMPTAMMSPEKIRTIFKDYVEDFLPAPAGHSIHANMRAGQITDDTQQTLVIADSILAHHTIDPTDIARRLITWCESVNAFDTLILGPSSSRSLLSIKQGKPIREAGIFGDTNGACMRISPVGIYAMGELERTVESVALACLPTHNTNIAISGASAIAMAIGTALSGESNVDSIIQRALQAAEMGMLKGNIWYGASILKRTELALQIVTSHQNRTSIMNDLYNIIGAGVAITETVPLALAVLKMTAGDPVDAIRIAVNLGGDCDTTASIIGGMCGAIAGIRAFPDKWIEKIEEVNHLHLDQYAQKLYDLVTGQNSK